MAFCIAAMNAKVELGQGTQSKFEKLNKNTNKKIKEQTDMQKEQLEPISQKMCEWAAPQWGTPGETLERTAMLAAEVAIYTSIIALNTYVNNQNYQIAKAYANLAKDRWQRFVTGYVPLETKLLAEAGNTPEPSIPYSEARTRGANATNFAYASAKSTLTDYAKRYALCVDDTYDYAKSQALMRDDNINFNYRDAEVFTEYLSDKRWNRRSAILNLGRDNLANSFNYAQQASSAFSDLSNTVAGVGSGLSGLLGYFFNRNETFYPAQFAQASRYGNGAIYAGPGASTTVGF